MSCPNCGRTMTSFSVGNGTRHSHCPQCGTYQWVNMLGKVREIVPELVVRCRELLANELAILHRTPPDQVTQAFTTAWLGMMDCITPHEPPR